MDVGRHERLFATFAPPRCALTINNNFAGYLQVFPPNVIVVVVVGSRGLVSVGEEQRRERVRTRLLLK